MQTNKGKTRTVITDTKEPDSFKIRVSTSHGRNKLIVFCSFCVWESTLFTLLTY